MRTKVFSAVAAAGALVALAAPAASAGQSTVAKSDSATTCPGGTLVSAVSAQRLAGGATAYRYELPDGTSFENVAPPAGFSYATASNAALAELGMPQRPTGAAAMKAWSAEVVPFTKSSINGSEKFCALSSAATQAGAAGTNQPAVDASPLALPKGNTSFSGYELSSGPYARAVGHFVQPATGTDIRSMSTWIGLNSYAGSAGRLIQAGAGNEVDYGSNPFWEEYCSGGSKDGCNGPAIDRSDFVRPGDTVSINVAYNKSAHTSFYQVAVTHETVTTLDINVPSHPVIDGGTSGGVVDFFTERTGGDQIPNSKNILFSASRTYASYSGGKSVPFGSQKRTASEMTANGKSYPASCSNLNVLMYPGDVTSGGFVNNYCRSTG